MRICQTKPVYPSFSLLLRVVMKQTHVVERECLYITRLTLRSLRLCSHVRLEGGMIYHRISCVELSQVIQHERSLLGSEQACNVEVLVRKWIEKSADQPSAARLSLQTIQNMAVPLRYSKVLCRSLFHLDLSNRGEQLLILQ